MVQADRPISTIPGNDSLDLATKVAWLTQPTMYPGGATKVETRETHMSWVFLTEHCAYKLKKPIRGPMTNWAELRDRERSCREEVSLNRRLAPSVYFGVLPLVRGPDGGLALGGEGQIVDWLVAMRRLPEALMLDRKIEIGTATPNDARAVGELLGRFYASLEPVQISAADYLGRFQRETEASITTLGQARFGLPLARIEAIARIVRSFMAGHLAVIEAPARERRIVEGHGDLRPEHVCLETPPIVIDCLEFNRNLRLVDPASEIAFLGMECARLGAPWIEPILFETCKPAQGEPAPLITFYKCVHTLVRARLAILHLDETPLRTPEKWPRLTEALLGRAEREAAMLPA